MSPEKIHEAIEETLARRAQREARAITITVQNEEAMLSGRVHSWADRQAVIKSASHTPGVKRVKDLLIIAPDF